MPVYIGIDPGVQGALCALDSSTGAAEFHPTPSDQNMVTPAGVLAWLKDVEKNIAPIRMIGMEQVHAIQGTSAKSTFNFGYNVGQLSAICQIGGYGLDLVKPLQWQRHIGAPTRQKAGGPAGLKKAVSSIAHRLYPHADLYGPKGGLLDGRADSLMIAHFIFSKYP